MRFFKCLRIRETLKNLRSAICKYEVRSLELCKYMVIFSSLADGHQGFLHAEQSVIDLFT